MWVSIIHIWEFWKAGQRFAVCEVNIDLTNETADLAALSSPEAAPVVCEFIMLVNEYLGHEFI